MADVTLNLNLAISVDADVEASGLVSLATSELQQLLNPSLASASALTFALTLTFALALSLRLWQPTASRHVSVEALDRAVGLLAVTLQT